MRLPEPQVRESHPLEEFFEPLRRTRAGHRRRRRLRRRRAAVVTMVHNEPVFLPIWLRYYSRHFRPQDIHVLDNDTTDGSSDREGFVRIPVSHDRVDHTWMVRTIEAYQHDLLGRYDSVLVTDVDEIVAPDPSLGTLAEYLQVFDEDFVNCLGYELLHLRDREPPFRPDLPVLEQRSYWFANDAYDKPALATVPMSWKPGFHWREDEHWQLDPDLRMIHLHRMDYDVCRERHRLRRGRAWDRRDVEAGWAEHNRLAGGEEFDRWFYGDSYFSGDGSYIPLEPIPEKWRSLF